MGVNLLYTRFYGEQAGLSRGEFLPFLLWLPAAGYYPLRLPVRE